MKTAVFSRFLARFCAEKVLRRLVQTSFLESNFKLPEVGVQHSTFNFRSLDFNFQLSEESLRLPTSSIWKLEVPFTFSSFLPFPLSSCIPYSLSPFLLFRCLSFSLSSLLPSGALCSFLPLLCPFLPSLFRCSYQFASELSVSDFSSSCSTFRLFLRPPSSYITKLSPPSSAITNCCFFRSLSPELPSAAPSSPTSPGMRPFTFCFLLSYAAFFCCFSRASRSSSARFSFFLPPFRFGDGGPRANALFVIPRSLVAPFP